MWNRLVWIAGVALALVPAAHAETAAEVVQWRAELNPTKPAAHSQATLRLTAAIKSGWHLYSITQAPGGPIPTRISFPEGSAVTSAGTPKGTPPRKSFDRNFNMDTETYSNEARFEIPVQVASAGGTANVNVRFQVCNDRLCLPPTTMHVAIPGFTPVNAGGPERASTRVSVPPAGTTPNSQPLGAYLWFAMGMGALSLLTPCVFPMVPITVSYFSNHGSGTRGGAVLQALIYGAGIVLTFSALGLALALLFGASGVNQLAANPWVNLLITVIFIAFAFSLFGAYLIQLPTGVMTRLNILANSRSAGGAIGALLMGLTFSLTSFTCTAPFVGTLLVTASQGNWRWPLAGMLAYSSVFAIPFVVLALAPQLMSQLPKAGGWMNSVKVVMGFLEIVAAMKFLSNADLIWQWNVFTREVVLAVWIAVGLMIVLYIFGVFRFEHDTAPAFVSAWRVTAALVFLAVTISLVPGLFGKPLGELESFLPPGAEESGIPGSGAGGIARTSWILNDLDRARTLAQEQKKPIFIDFTGYTCTNCRWMEANVFPKPPVRDELQKFITVRLYTDGEGAVYERQQNYQRKKFGTVALPLYAIIDGNDRTLATSAGITRSVEEFARFLQRGLAQASTT